MFRAAFLVNLVSRRRVSEGPIELIAVARDAMLAQLRRRCESAGVTMRFGRRLENPNETLDAGVDLIVGADGVHSVVRLWRAEWFGAATRYVNSYHAWLATRGFSAARGGRVSRC